MCSCWKYFHLLFSCFFVCWWLVDDWLAKQQKVDIRSIICQYGPTKSELILLETPLATPIIQDNVDGDNNYNNNYVRLRIIDLFLSSENCPACFEAPKERQRIKQLLAQQELLFPRLYWNLKTALFPVMRIDRTGLESVVFGRASADAVADDVEEEDCL